MTSLVFLGAFIQIIGGSAYIRDTLKGKTKPNRVTYTIWTIAPLIGTAAGLADGVGWAILPVFMSGLMPLLSLLASFYNKQAYWRLHSSDYICGVLSILALFLWWATNEPVAAIIFAVLSDALAALPTIIKSWRHPETETGLAYIASLLNSVTSFFVIRSWGISSLMFPIYLIIQNSLVILGVYRKRL